ncbi:MAG TPA: 3-deoxy-8-phosphooctulonate synthase [Candidatus Eisenbacteria bacterium]|nr:3-deoxy-8-phosphooctulonate synthase [Candidatus Eisenbacteria bacterium]
MSSTPPRIAPVRVGPVAFGPERLGLIAGPCALEDEGEAMEIAREVKRIAGSLGMPFVFKASYAKANRTSGDSYRGPGPSEGLRSLARIREAADVPVTSDVHESTEVGDAAAVLDLLQIPAFLCRQTPLIEAAAQTGKPLHVKKGQFLSPSGMRHVVDKARAAGAAGVILTERGTTFGHGDLVVDFRGLPTMRALGCPVFFDATHSVQRPAGVETGGDRAMIPILARAAVAAGADGIFIETHPAPERARSDRESQWPLAELEELLRSLMKIRQAVADTVVLEGQRA